MSFCKFAAAVSFWMAASLSFGCCDDKKPIADALYSRAEDTIRKDWEYFEYAKLERERKAKAGEPFVSDKMLREGTDGVKMILYNKAVIGAVCGEESIHASKNADEAIASAKSCVDAKLSEMAKFTKLTDYYDSVSARKFETCEMKSRDYKNEMRFVPYEFLRNSDGPKLFDFKALMSAFFRTLGEATLALPAISTMRPY
jgi:hypothetical protein